MRGIAVLPLLLAVACEGPPTGGGPRDDDLGADAAPEQPAPDAEPIPADPVDYFGPSLVFDDVHIADWMEEENAFQLLGFALNGQLEQAIADGTFLLGVSFIDLTDPSGQNGTFSVAAFGLVDSDDDPTDNFDPDNPEQFTIAQGGTLLPDIPTIHFTEGSVEDGEMFASRVGIVTLIELIFAVADAEFEGTLIASDDGEHIVELVDGRIRGALSGGPLALIPNPIGEMCTGGTMLDVLVTGCGFLPLPLQPDTDIDGDGLETYEDTDGDGVIDLCTDGDGTEIVGDTCTTDFRMADGYSFAWVLHGVRAHIDQTIPPPPEEI